MQSAADLYAERASRFAARADALGARSRMVSNLRGLAFAAAVIAAGFALFGGAAAVGGPVAALSAVTFAVFVAWHARVIEAEDDARRWARVNLDGQARCTGRWRELPEDGRRFLRADHPYADDLDLFGRGSLFQRVCVAHTHFGQEALASWIGSISLVAEIAERQARVRSLAQELEIRQRLEALSLAVVDPAPARDGDSATARRQRGAPDPEPLLRWAEGEPRLSRRPMLVWGARLLPPITVAGMVAAWVGGVPALVWAIPLLLQIALAFSVSAETTRVFTAVSSTEGAFLRYGAMLELAENLAARSELLDALRKRLLTGELKPSSAMKDFKRKVGWFDLRHNGLIHPIINAILLWDIHCVLGLERWQQTAGRRTRGWFQALGELEALSSIAGLAHDEPDFVFPQIVEGTARFEADSLGHPLIDAPQRVANDISLAEPGHALLVTGSNMSGKSTLLRAMGLATVMAYTGGPICAKKLLIGKMTLRTSIRVRDSLEQGVSHFYAEIGKLKAVVDAANGPEPLFFLLDEILHGTNSRERQIGARWVLRELLEKGAIGAVSTHDLELCRLPDTLMQKVSLVHFRENVEDGKMTFDYRVRQGPVTAGNALRLMRIVGLQVPVE